MEADLARFYGVDYRDRWRGELTLRRLFVLVRHLPDESAVGVLERDGGLVWSIEAHLLDDLRMAVQSAWSDPKSPPPKIHPARAVRRRQPDPERARKLVKARLRAAERKQQLEGGDA